MVFTSDNHHKEMMGNILAPSGIYFNLLYGHVQTKAWILTRPKGAFRGETKGGDLIEIKSTNFFFVHLII